MFSDLPAGFITAASPAQPVAAPATYLRRGFDVGTDLVRATLRFTAIGLVEAHLNGQRVGDEVLTPGWTSYTHRLVVSSFDVTSSMSVGSNAVGAILGDGWALGRLGWADESQHFSDRRALWLDLELTYPDRTEHLGTDESWRSGTGGTLANSLYDGETFDARLEPSGWSEAGFEDASWSTVQPFEWPLESLIEPVSEPIRRVEELNPVAVLTTPAGKTVVDFGQEFSGWVRIKATGPAGTTITLRHAEWMTDGELDPETLRSARSVDTITLAGTGQETWEPRFTFHGFRYVEVDGWPGTLDPTDITGVVVHTDMTRTGWFSSSDEQLNRLHENVVWSMRGNFVGVPTDCPQRDERLGWTGDINAFGPTAAFLHDVRGVLGSWLEDLAAEQFDKGFVPWVVPDVLANKSTPTALWSDVAVSLPWNLYREYGDEAILVKAYPSMSSFVRNVAGLLDEHDLWSTGFQYGDWLDPDAPIDNPAGGKTDRHLVACAYLAKVTREMAATAEVLGHEADAAEFAALASRVRKAFRREYTSASGRVVGESATGYALAIAFDLFDADQRQHAGDQLARLVAKSGYTISTGFAGTPLVTEALSSTGHLDEAYLLLLEKHCPSFLYPVTMGATTIWERWDSIRPDGTINPSGMTSLNHYALGAVASWMHRVIGGLTAIDPGYRTMRIAPQPGGHLTHASVLHDTVHGQVEVAWSIQDGTVAVDVSIPEGTTAEVVLPLHPDALTERVVAGTYHWSYSVEAGWGERPEYTMDSTLAALGADPAVWRVVSDVFATYLPGIPIDATAPEAAGISLNTMLDLIPGDQEALRGALVDALAAPATELEGTNR